MIDTVSMKLMLYSLFLITLIDLFCSGSPWNKQNTAWFICD